MHPENKIKIGYLSPDFGNHPVGLLINHLFPLHSPRFETYGLFLKTHLDPIGQALSTQFTHRLFLEQQTDQEQVRMIKALELDILIDLAGHTRFQKQAILVSQCAPIQAQWLGYPGTLRLPQVQYYITDAIQTPMEYAPYFTEKLLHLPETYFACSGFEIPELPHMNKPHFNLPEDAFIFCCFHSHIRINYPLFLAWCRILQKVPDSVLWLNSGGTQFDRDLKQKFSEQHITPSRIIFSPKENMTQSWRHRLADLWLDTWTLSGGTSSILSLWAGVPVLTRLGNAPHRRTGAAINHAAQMNHMTVNSEEEYIEMAIHCATHPSPLQHLGHTPLFQPQRFLQHLEQAYLQMLGH
jgi:predicted O-linked N-acetylglucosamine transferase (SPINDLY family)